MHGHGTDRLAVLAPLGEIECVIYVKSSVSFPFCLGEKCICYMYN